MTCAFPELVARRRTPNSCKDTKMATPIDFCRGMSRPVNWYRLILRQVITCGKTRWRTCERVSKAREQDMWRTCEHVSKACEQDLWRTCEHMSKAREQDMWRTCEHVSKACEQDLWRTCEHMSKAREQDMWRTCEHGMWTGHVANMWTCKQGTWAGHVANMWTGHVANMWARHVSWTCKLAFARMRTFEYYPTLRIIVYNDAWFISRHPVLSHQKFSVL